MNATLATFDFVETKAETGQQQQQPPAQYGQAQGYGQPPQQQQYPPQQPQYGQAPPQQQQYSQQPPAQPPQYGQAPPAQPQQNYNQTPW